MRWAGLAVPETVPLGQRAPHPLFVSSRKTDFPRTLDSPCGSSMLSWLLHGRVVDERGAVSSWVNPGHPGYAYPEAAALLLSLLVIESEGTQLIRDRIASRIVADLSPRGGLGRRSVDYAFDSAMGLAALAAHVESGGDGVAAKDLIGLRGFVEGCLRERRAAISHDALETDRWSRRFNCHLLKAGIGLDMAYRALPGEPSRAGWRRDLLDELLPLFDGERFRIDGASPRTYVHAHCYAVEGLLYMRARGVGELDDVLESSARWLADIQWPDGGIPAWADGAGPAAGPHGDTTAQAIRIWCCLDPQGFASRIASGSGFLRTLQSPDGGLRYAPHSKDVNCWVTVYGLQASRWMSRPPGSIDPLHIV